MTKVYAVAESVPEELRFMFEQGKRYQTFPPARAWHDFDIIDEEGDRVGCRWSGDTDVGNWTRIEEEAPTPEQTQERAVEAVARAIRELELWLAEVEIVDIARAAIAAMDAFKKSEVGHD